MTLRYSRYQEKFDGGEQLYVFTTIPCPQCKASDEIEVKGRDLYRYNQGAFIQDAFPYLSPADRERLMSGYCGPCFDVLFSDEESEE